MQLHLVDVNEAVVNAWSSAFAELPNVTIRCADIFQFARNTVVSPSNSYGYMDGGIDARYREFFGPSIESVIREAILRRPEEILPVGASIVVRTNNTTIPYMVVAATMVMPEHVPAENAYRSMRAILRVASADPAVGQTIFCPGLTTGVGGVAPKDAASQMADAYRDWLNIA